MTTEKAIRILRSFQEPEAWESRITEDAYNALQMAIDVLKEKGRNEDDGNQVKEIVGNETSNI